MIQTYSRVTGTVEILPNIFILSFVSPEIAAQVEPGQFVNIKVDESPFPLLRRPFSVYRVEGDVVSVIFNIVGIGTSMLSAKRQGDRIDLIGPLGHPFNVQGAYDTAILVAGGMGVAPLPILTESLRETSKEIVTYLGARSAGQLVDGHLHNVQKATDDGSSGFRGTVVELLRRDLAAEKFKKPKIFSCGPHPMLHSLAALAEEYGVPCEVSLESVMACGIGICQGCPVEVRGGDRKYALICKEGTVFDTRNIHLS